jgi:hypothetical protein
MNEHDKPKHGCLRALAWGCGCLVLAVVLLIAAVYLGRDLVKEMDWYKSLEGATEQAKADIGVAVAISEELEERWPAEDISMGTHTRFGSDAGTTLTIQILNPTFSIAEGEDGEATAREIAVYAAARFPRIQEIDDLVVEIHRYRDGFTSKQRYGFPVESLLPEVQSTDKPM